MENVLTLSGKPSLPLHWPQTTLDHVTSITLQAEGAVLHVVHIVTTAMSAQPILGLAMSTLTVLTWTGHQAIHRNEIRSYNGSHS